ncbi:MAG: ABC transporter permease [Acutalibacteraceae bacterium]
MKQFKTIFKFELKNYFINKAFVGITVFLMLLIAVVMFFPRIAEAFDGGGQADGAGERAVMLITADTQENTELAREAFAAAFTDYEVIIADNKGEIKQKISDGTAECGFALDGLTSYTYYVDNLSMYDENTYAADEVLQNIYRLKEMTAGGISADRAGAILSVTVSHETQSLGKDQFKNFFYTYIMIFALYMVILLYGQMVATNVASEKSSRAMELLVTSAKPTAMMFGKVLASCLAGLIQLVCVFGSAFLFYNLNEGYWSGNTIISSIFGIPLDLLLYMLLFFLLGFFIYAFMYGAVGSTVSKLEDINTAVMPITMLFIIAFMVVMFSMSSGNVDTPIMLICSYIPFTSPMAMFTRIAMSTVPAYEIIISVSVLVGSVIGVGVLSAKIYRVGVLLYGTSPKIGSVLKAVFKA